MSRFALTLALAAALVSTASCSAVGVNTQVMVTVDAESGVQSASHNLVVRVFGGRRGADPSNLDLLQEIPAPVSPGVGWPTTVALAPLDRDATRIYRVEAAAYDDVNVSPTSVPIATVRAISGYVPNQTVWLRLLIQDDCIGHPCIDVTTTCVGGLCVSAEVSASSLPPWNADGGARLDAGPTMDGGPDAAPPCTATSCDDALSCTDDFCGAMGCVHFPHDDRCDDHEICTDDRCNGTTGTGCTHTPNTVSCDDHTFCNGLDQCGGGSCSVHPGNPCGTHACTEATSDCGTCVAVGDCPAPTFGAWSSCTYASACATSGTQTRPTRTFSCNASHVCVPADDTELTACDPRTTEGLTCASSTCDSAGTCHYGATCDQTGSAPQTCHDFLCASGTCADTFRSSSVTCTRTTDTNLCDDGSSCTGSDMCSSGICSGTPICDGGTNDAAGGCFDDGIACTRDGLDAGVCVHTPDDAYCDDGITCSMERCDPAWPGRDTGGCRHDYSGCMPDAGPPSDAGIAPCVMYPSLCMDGNPCTADSCAPGADGGTDSNGCRHVITTCGSPDGST